MKHRSVPKASGFSLIEISMVMVAIGFLITGAFYGVRLYEETQVKAVYSTVQTISQAYKQFKDKYNALPGDMIDAQARIQGCSVNCKNGDGDGFIGQTGKVIHDSFNPLVAQDEENTQFWYHLQRAGMINTVNPTIPSNVPAQASFSRTAPKVQPKGGLVVRVINQDVCDTGTGRPADLVGTWLVWQASPLTTDPVIDVRYAAHLDQKYDDGQPGYGNIRASGGTTMGIGDSCRADLKTYRPAGFGNCFMFFRISRGID